MREIKFRAWFEQEQKMVTHENLALSYDGEDGFDFAFDKTEYTHDGEHVKGTMLFELMQYTGLKDVNGKEVYEGDILKYGSVVTYVDGSKGEDLGMSIGFYSQRDDFESWSMLEAGEDIEVIGNIYESEDNPCD